MHVPARDRRRIIGELTDDFFEDVLERDETEYIPVFVDDEAKAATLALEVRELHGQRRAVGNVIGFALPGDLLEPFAIKIAPREFLRDASHMHEAYHLTDVAAIDGQARVRRLPQLLEDALRDV